MQRMLCSAHPMTAMSTAQHVQEERTAGAIYQPSLSVLSVGSGPEEGMFVRSANLDSTLKFQLTWTSDRCLTAGFAGERVRQAEIRGLLAY